MDWAVLAIVLLSEHVLHTGDLELAAEYFDVLWHNYSFVDHIHPTDHLVYDATALVDWPTGASMF